MNKVLQVGIIGASAERGWAKISHVPAVQGLAGLELGAVATRDQPSAERAAQAFGARAAYADPWQLFADPSIDIVTVAVNVPAHRDLLLGAVAAGKHIYCEYPLGRGRAESEALAEAARAAGIHVAIGLQTRSNPAVRKARELIASGAVGRVLGARIVSTTMAFGPEVEAAMAFAEAPENGVTLATIQGAHTLDTAIAVLGELAGASALATTQYPQVEVEGGGTTRQARTTPDHLLVQARLAGGAPLSVEVAGGRPPEATPFRFAVTGEAHGLVLEGGAPRGFQSGRLRLLLDGAAVPVDEGEAAPMPDEAANVSLAYAALRDDILHGTATATGFGQAARVAKLIEDMLESSRTGAWTPAAGWPEQG
jgi:predicted dehydrogenase